MPDLKNILLDGYFKKYCMGESIENLADQLLEYAAQVPQMPLGNYEDILSFEKIKHMVVYKLVNTKKKMEY